MTSSVDQAKDLLTLSGGPGVFGVSALLGYATQVLSGDDLLPRKGWFTLGAGALASAWITLFLVLSAATMVGSWSASGSVSPVLVLLTATWLASLGLLVAVLAHTKAVCHYLWQSYDPDSQPWLLRVLAKVGLR